jgi:hypothetical protein
MGKTMENKECLLGAWGLGLGVEVRIDKKGHHEQNVGG